MAALYIVEGQIYTTAQIYSIAKSFYGFKGCKVTMVARLRKRPGNLTWAYLAAEIDWSKAEMSRKSAEIRANKMKAERKEIDSLMDGLDKRKAEIANKIADEECQPKEDE